MRFTSSLRVDARALLSAMLMLVCAAGANATDTYNVATQQATIPTLSVGNATLTNVVVGVAGIVTPPSGTSAYGDVDVYDPATKNLTVQSVSVAGNTYYNVVVTLSSLVSIGGASGVDTYDGTNLNIPAVLVGGTVYTNVVVKVGLADVAGVNGDAPVAVMDSYDAGTGVLSVPAVTAFGHVYTNVTLNVTLAKVVSVGGHHSASTNVMSVGLNSDGSTATAGAPGAWFTYFGAATTTVAGGAGGGYLDQGTDPSYEYVYISDSLANIGAYSYQGVGVRAGADQTVTASGNNALSYSMAVNPEWYGAAGGANFVVLITAHVPGVSNSTCDPVVAAVVKATGSGATAYNTPLSSFDAVRQNCGWSSVTATQILAGTIIGVDFQADGGNSAITASGLTSNSNLTVAAVGGVYPTTVNLVGGVKFVTLSTSSPGVISAGFNSDQTTTTAAGGVAGQWATYFGGADAGLVGGAGGGFADQGANPSYVYVYINDTLANLTVGAVPYTYQGVKLLPATNQALSAVGFNNVSFTLAVNQEWFSTTAGANFVVLIVGDVTGVSNPTCFPSVVAVVSATTGAATGASYVVPFSAFTHVSQNCGVTSVTPAQILAAPIKEIDFQADGQMSSFTASGLTSNINLSVPAAGSNPVTYPTTISVIGGVSFIN